MRRRLKLSRGRIRRYVDRALLTLPIRFREAADNVMVVVESQPTQKDRAGSRRAVRAFEGALIRQDPLVGIYRGIPLSERAGYQLVTPDVIAIFRKPLLRIARSRRDANEEVRLTVLHEFGHFLGLSEREVEHL
ncbi:MAG TPA: metallopeptidase family protein [Chloroflexota bacterium]|nr:metallopeptidase family protein [Chloroflexota bacterium]